MPSWPNAAGRTRPAKRLSSIVGASPCGCPGRAPPRPPPLLACPFAPLSVCSFARLPACPSATRHTPLPHTITSPYPVSMKAARKLPTLSHLHTSAFQTALPSPLSYLHNEHRRLHDDFRICFSYPINCWLVLALEFDITSETIRFETTPTGTIDAIVYTAGVPLLTPEPIPSDRGSAQPPLRFVHHTPQTMVISAAVGSSARLPVCQIARMPGAAA